MLPSNLSILYVCVYSIGGPRNAEEYRIPLVSDRAPALPHHHTHRINRSRGWEIVRRRRKHNCKSVPSCSSNIISFERTLNKKKNRKFAVRLIVKFDIVHFEGQAALWKLIAVIISLPSALLLTFHIYRDGRPEPCTDRTGCKARSRHFANFRNSSKFSFWVSWSSIKVFSEIIR